MPTTNARKHLIPSGTDTTVSRETIFETWGNSIRDVVPVANETERAQLVTALQASDVGQGPSGARPLYVHRLDAPGMHRTEYTTDGVTWITASGTQFFPDVATANAFGTANGSLLNVGDKARIAGVPYEWSGTAWVGGWNDLVFSNQWDRHPNTNYPKPGVSRINGVVWVRGTLQRTVQSDSAPGQLIATLPLGYRPSAIQVATIWANGAARSVEVRPDGAVLVGDTAISWARADLYFPFPAGT